VKLPRPAEYAFSRPLAFATIPKLESRRAVVQDCASSPLHRKVSCGGMKIETSILHPERSRRVGGSLIPIVLYRDGDGFSLILLEALFLMRQIRDFLRTEHLIIDANIINQAEEESPLSKHLVGTEIQAAIRRFAGDDTGIFCNLCAIHI